MISDETINIISQLNTVATLLAFVIGGIWVIYKFHIFRIRKPKLNIEQYINFIKRTDSGYIVRVNISLTNIGDVILSNIDGHIVLNNLDNISKDTLRSEHWNANNIRIKSLYFDNFEYVPLHLEPGESETAHALLHLNVCPKKLEFYSLIENYRFRGLKNFFGIENKPYGWVNSTITNLLSMSKKEHNPKYTTRNPKPDETRQGYGRDRIGDKPDAQNQGEGRMRPQRSESQTGDSDE